MKTPPTPEAADNDPVRSFDPNRAASKLSSAHDHPHLDTPEITAKIDEYRMRIMQNNAEHGMLPFFLATLSFSALFANFGSRVGVLGWLCAVLSLTGLRLFLIAK